MRRERLVYQELVIREREFQPPEAYQVLAVCRAQGASRQEASE